MSRPLLWQFSPPWRILKGSSTPISPEGKRTMPEPMPTRSIPKASPKWRACSIRIVSSPVASPACCRPGGGPRRACRMSWISAVVLADGHWTLPEPTPPARHGHRHQPAHDCLCLSAGGSALAGAAGRPKRSDDYMELPATSCFSEHRRADGWRGSCSSRGVCEPAGDVMGSEMRSVGD